MSKKEQNTKGPEKDQNLGENEIDQNEMHEDVATEEARSEEAEMDEVEQLKNEVQKEKDNFLRLFAEFENYKKRALRDAAIYEQRVSDRLILEFLPLYDTLSL